MNIKDSYTASRNPFIQCTVLVVDKFENMRVSVSAMLLEMGFEKVLQANHGAEALNVIKSQKVDIVICESQLPKIDGTELLRRIRADEQTALLPFVMMSATIEQHLVVEAIKSGVSEYIVKPFSPKILVDRMGRALTNPVKHRPTAKAATTPTAPEEQQPMQILVVDDVVDNIKIITDILRKDYKIKAATSGEKALKSCAKSPPDLVLLDIMMPQMDGMTVCKKLKANPATAHITVIFLTALDQTKHIVKGFELGAVDYITKPINPPVVKARVATHCKLIQSNKILRGQIDAMMENARLESEFNRIMQNDLKHPLEEVMKSVEMIDKTARDPKKVKQNAGCIRMSCTLLSQMVDNMTTLNKLEEGNYLLVPVKLDLVQAIQNVIDTYAPSISEKCLEVNFNPEQNHYFRGEALLTSSLLSNLYKNAIEAAPRGSVITIEIESQDQFEQVLIHNKGEVPYEIHDAFFDKYVTAGKSNGNGVGTYAAKMMVDVQQGKIHFESNQQHGTTLYVSLPGG